MSHSRLARNLNLSRTHRTLDQQFRDAARDRRLMTFLLNRDFSSPSLVNEIAEDLVTVRSETTQEEFEAFEKRLSEIHQETEDHGNDARTIMLTIKNIDLVFTLENFEITSAFLRLYIRRLIREHNSPNADEKYGISLLNTYGRPVHGVDRYAHGFHINFVTNPIELLLQRIVDTLNKYSDDNAGYITVSEVTVSRFAFNRIQSRGAPRSIPHMSKKFLIIDTHATSNCFWIALATGVNWRENKSLLTEAAVRQKAGANLKARVKKKFNLTKMKEFADQEDYQRGAEYTNHTIQFLSSDFQDLAFYEPKTETSTGTVFIFHDKGHARVLIRKKDIEEVHDIELPRHKEKVVAELGQVKKKGKDFNGVSAVVELGDGTIAYEAQRFSSVEELIESLPKYLQYEDHQEKDIVEIISKEKAKLKKLGKPVNHKIAAWDIESCPMRDDRNGIHRAYALGLAWKSYMDEQHYYASWEGYGTAVSQFMEWLYENRFFFDGYTFVAHNGAKFDNVFLLNEYLFKNTDKWQASMLENSGKIISLRITSVEKDRSNKRVEIKFSDTLLLAPCPLATLTRDMKVKHQKLVGSVDHSKLTDENWTTFMPQVRPYLKNDCLGLLEVYDRLVADLAKNQDMDLTDYNTGASLAINTFFLLYYKENEYPIYSMSSGLDEKIRSGYYGGRTEAFTLGEAHNIFYFDVNSEYPAVGCKDLPYGAPEEIGSGVMRRLYCNREGELQDNFFGFVYASVESTNMEYSTDDVPQLHCVKVVSGGATKLLFPKFKEDSDPIWIFSEEMKYGQTLGIYKYKIKAGIKFQRGPIMREFFTSLYEKRLAVKKTEPGTAYCYKIEMNSTYGRMAIRIKGRDAVTMSLRQKADYVKPYYDDRLIGLTIKGEYALVREIKDLGIRDFNVSIGAAITAYGRMVIHGACHDVKKKGGIVHYVDTDSVQFSFPGKSFEYCKKMTKKLLEKWNAGDPEAKKLGSMKNEFVELLEGACHGKDPVEVAEAKRIAAEQGYCFARGIVIGAKQYILENQLTENICVSTNAFKGLSQSNDSDHTTPEESDGKYVLKYSDFEEMLEGETFLPYKDYSEELEEEEEEYKDEDGITRTRIVSVRPKGQMNFKGGKEAITTDIKKNAGIKVTYGPRSYKMNYTKGKWNREHLKESGGFVHVKPLKINYVNI